ncbi:hypothetical protein RA27_08845 [Ruegeria sp. ANG-R]|uniref:NusA N-terminal domain-containing protein n=1 Tax=Ruegeria sp. ANG-R TaxID=1577903 RepID=UPI00057DCE10|nr:NusA N-terminal domain-containing protein [Ruegeria sp. ANG-R]KIC43365.1 hypothetical protein RA27_08845 [Ruegeria sp. ANG-R]
MTEDPIVEIAEPLVLEADRSLLALAGAISKEQGIPQEVAIREVEASYVRAAEAEYGPEYEFWAQIKADGTVQLAQVLKVVKAMRNEYREVALDDLRKSHPEARPGQYVVNALAPIHPHRISEWMQPRQTRVENLKITSR